MLHGRKLLSVPGEAAHVLALTVGFLGCACSSDQDSLSVNTISQADGIVTELDEPRVECADAPPDREVEGSWAGTIPRSYGRNCPGHYVLLVNNMDKSEMFKFGVAVTGEKNCEGAELYMSVYWPYQGEVTGDGLHLVAHGVWNSFSKKCLLPAMGLAGIINARPDVKFILRAEAKAGSRRPIVVTTSDP